MVVARFDAAVPALAAIPRLRRAARRSGASWAVVGGTGASAHGYGARPDLLRIAALTVGGGRLDVAGAAAVDRWDLEPRRWHGSWGGRDPFAALERSPAREGPVAVVTHARIRPAVLRQFWRRVPGVAEHVVTAPGYVTGFGFGTVPLTGLATFSVWESAEAARAMGWGPGQHRDVIDDVRRDGWFTEELFAWFTPSRAPA